MGDERSNRGTAARSTVVSGVAAGLRGAVRWSLGRWRRWQPIIRLIPAAGPAAVVAMTLNLVIGVLPLGFMIGTSVAIERAAAAARAPGADSWDRTLTAVGLALAALLLQTALSPFQAAFTELISRRVDGVCARQLMRTALADAPVDLLERQDVLDKLDEARRGMLEAFTTPGAAVAGLITLIARYAQLVGAVLIVGVVLGPLAGGVICLSALVARFGQRGSLARWSVIFDRTAQARRKMYYILDSGSGVTAAKEIRVLGTLPWWRSRAAQDGDAWLRPMWRDRRRVFLAPFMAFSLVVLAGAVTVLVLIGDAADHGRLGVLGLSLALQAILVPLRFGVFFPEADVQTQYGMQAHDSMLEIEREVAARSPGLPRSGGRPAAGVPAAGISFERVSFAYPGTGRDVLAQLDLDFPVGTATAIVGLNGAGKTTLVKLLARLYEPTGGRITVDGIALTDFDVRSWQRRLAVIYQDYVRYELDMAANVGLGAPERIGDLAALERACEWAGATEVSGTLPEGLATILSSHYPGGVDLSGGQWQRIALARALFAVQCGASVLVLDEPTAQLDVRAEVAFFDRFLELTRGLTTVVISHRFSTVRRADRIVVLDGGRITEQGSHEELKAAGGRYAELFELQARRFADDQDPAQIASTDDTQPGPTRERAEAAR